MDAGPDAVDFRAPGRGEHRSHGDLAGDRRHVPDLVHPDRFGICHRMENGFHRRISRHHDASAGAHVDGLGRAVPDGLFPGQGSQKTHMLRDLALTFPEFRASLEQVEQSLAGRFPKKLSAYIYPPPAFSPEQSEEHTLEITDTVVAQPALGVVEIGLCRTLERLGVRPDMTAGHSYGEYVALAAAGVISDIA